MRWVALMVLGLYSVLASYCYGTISPYAGTIKHDRRTENASAAREVKVWRTDKAALIAEIWNISPDEIEKPPDIFNK